eukprot:EG_transcript_4241
MVWHDVLSRCTEAALVVSTRDDSIVACNARSLEYFRRANLTGLSFTSLVAMFEPLEVGLEASGVVFGDMGQCTKYSILCNAIRDADHLMLLEMEPAVGSRTASFSSALGLDVASVAARQYCDEDDEAVQWSCRFDQSLGEGGTGEVYLGELGEEGLSVAVKVIACGEEGKVLAQHTEIQALKRLHHPHIIRYWGSAVDWEEATITVALEYAPHGCLQRVVDESGPLEAPFLAMWLGDILQGLAYIHAEGIIHCDIKPSNVLLCDAPHRPACKITDFGSAVPCDMLQSPRPCVGTAAYMAPEQFEGNTGYYTDVWAFGILAVFLATGRLPYPPAATLGSMQMMFAIAVGNLRPAIPDELVPPLRDGVESCLSAEASSRPSAHALLGLLLEHAEYVDAD